MNKRVCIATGGRADWGLLTPLAQALRDAADIELQVIATNMHLESRFGMTVNEITEAGFSVDARVPMDCEGDTPPDRARAMARCLDGMAQALDTLKPGCLIILGDRYEMLATASAATMLRIPVAHIAGGTVSRGAVDDNIRHAITKLSALHLVETPLARRRVIQMGEDPARVHVTGALGVYNILKQKLWNRSQLAQWLGGFSPDPSDTLLVTYHPATLETEDPGDLTDRLLAALDRFPGYRILFTHPNNDAGGQAVARRIADYAQANPHRVKAVRSLGMIRYLSALRYVAAVVGNSSSGIVEVPSMHIPTVDIGMRQEGRERASSVIHCENSAHEIAAAITLALSPEGRRMAREAVNPYFRPDTLEIMVSAIRSFLRNPSVTKDFHLLDTNSQ